MIPLALLLHALVLAIPCMSEIILSVQSPRFYHGRHEESYEEGCSTSRTCCTNEEGDEGKGDEGNEEVSDLAFR